MARRLVRDQASLIVVALVALSACSKRGCACLAGYAPEIGVADLEPLSFDIWQQNDHGGALVYFALGKPGDGDMCPRLADGTSLTLNGVTATVHSLGGATGTKALDTVCRRADFFWKDVPLANEPKSTIVIDDGKTKLECTLGLGLPLRLASLRPVKAPHDDASLVIDANAPDATLTVEQAQVGVDGELALMPLVASDIHPDGNHVAITVPAKLLPKAGGYHIVVDATIQAIPACSPPRKTRVPSSVHVRSTFPFTVTR